MIPKIIHYCWFGGNVLPKEYEKYIDSWKSNCPDYQIQRWDESNFDINCCKYVREAYEAKKWAFVADYVRFYVLYEYGGIYFDTDVELLRPIDELLIMGNFMGTEYSHDGLVVNPGLGLGARPHLEFYKEMLSMYESISFYDKDRTYNMKTVVDYTTGMLTKHGKLLADRIVNICDINIFPVEYFCPMDSFTGEINITDKTYSIHHYSGSWLDKENKFYYDIKRKFAGSRYKQIAISVLLSPLRVYGKIKLIGWSNTWKLLLRYMFG